MYELCTLYSQNCLGCGAIFFSLGGEVLSQTKVNHSQSTEPKQGPIVPVIRAVGEGVGLGAALFILLTNVLVTGHSISKLLQFFISLQPLHHSTDDVS